MESEDGRSVRRVCNIQRAVTLGLVCVIEFDVAGVNCMNEFSGPKIGVGLPQPSISSSAVKQFEISLHGFDSL